LKSQNGCAITYGIAVAVIAKTELERMCMIAVRDLLRSGGDLSGTVVLSLAIHNARELTPAIERRGKKIQLPIGADMLPARES